MKLGEFIDSFDEGYFNSMSSYYDKYSFRHENYTEIELSKERLKDLRMGDVKYIKEILKRDRASIYNHPLDSSNSVIKVVFDTEKGGDVSIFCFNFYEISEILKTIDPLIEKYKIKDLKFCNTRNIEEYKVVLNGSSLDSHKLKDISKEIEYRLDKRDRGGFGIGK